MYMLYQKYFQHQKFDIYKIIFLIKNLFLLNFDLNFVFQNNKIIIKHRNINLEYVN